MRMACWLTRLPLNASSRLPECEAEHSESEASYRVAARGGCNGGESRPQDLHIGPGIAAVAWPPFWRSLLPFMRLNLTKRQPNGILARRPSFLHCGLRRRTGRPGCRGKGNHAQF